MDYSRLAETGSYGPKLEYFKAGGALTMRISNTVLKYAIQITGLPILESSDSRLSPETVDGFSLTSREIECLRREAAHFTGLTKRNQPSHDSGRRLGHRSGPSFMTRYVLDNDRQFIKSEA